ncbi:hypothetical protein [Paraburkholderia sacchari]|uniref:hypothetical protein n=1 Tax=Paraburkholderia sacchari TaxID=159450 RepID=UPI001BCD272E|nr:hypothetical protein [Paraburkholderia sacchari]
MPSLKPETTTPRVEAVIDAMCARFPGASKASQNRYFEAVHQELAPLARELERENRLLREQLSSLEAELRTKWFAEPVEWQVRYMGDPRQPGFWARANNADHAKGVYETFASHMDINGWQYRPVYGVPSESEGNRSPINGDQP